MFASQFASLVLVAALSAVINTTTAGSVHRHSGGGRQIGTVDSLWQPGMTSMNKEPLTVASGDAIEITCTSEHRSAIAWQFPSKYAPLEDSADYGTVEITETEDLESSLYHSTLRVYNASYRDTGRYRCYCPGLNNYEHALKHAGNRITGKISIYVYVTDEEHLFLVDPQPENQRMKAVMAIVGRPYTFPCAVTSPDAELRLYKLKGYNIEIKLPTDNSGRLASSLQTGVTLSSVSMMDTGVYICRAVIGGIEQEKRFLVYAVTAAPRLLEPTLSTDHITTATGAIVEGDNFSLKCQAPVGQHQTSTISWWKTDGHSNMQQMEADNESVSIDGPSLDDLCSGDRNMCSFKRKYTNLGLRRSSTYQKITSRLRVTSSDTTFSGTYYCKVHSTAGKVAVSNPVGLHVNPLVNQVASHQSTVSQIASYQPVANQNDRALRVIRVERLSN